MKAKLYLLCVIFFVTITTFAQTGTTELNFVKKGSGSPVVLFESGLGDGLESWKQIQDSVSKITTTISYDRLGLGKSSATENPRTLENMVTEIKGFLENEEIDGPYILVGHSMGGFIIRKFQDSYPEKVLGLVFVDPAHENLWERILASKSAEEADKLKKEWDEFNTTSPIAVQNEIKEIPNMETEMKAIDFPEDIPIILIASYQLEPGFLNPEGIEIKKEIFKDWIEDKPNAKQISTVKSGHYIHYTEPIIVIGAIFEMIENVKSK